METTTHPNGKPMKPYVIVEQFRLVGEPDRSRRCITGFSDLRSAEKALPSIVQILRDCNVSAVEEPPRIVALADLAGRDRAEFLKLPTVHSFTAYYPNEPAPLEAREMAPTQATLNTEAPPLPIPSSALPEVVIVYQIRYHDIGKSAREIYGCETLPDAVDRLRFVAPQHDDKTITIEAEAAIVRFEDLADRDRAEYLTAMMSGNDGTQYFLNDGETVPTPAAVEVAPDEAAARPGYQPGSYAEYVARREARLARKAKNYGKWSEKREEKAAETWEKREKIAKMIPFGQPILVGHHSEGRHRRDLSRMDRLIGQSVEHSQKAKEFAHKSEACAAALDRQTDPGFCQRRIDEAEAGIRKCEKELLYCKVRQSEQASIDHWNLWLGRYQEQKAFWSARLESVGGPRVTVADIKMGDSIRYRGEGFCEVIRVNKKTVTAMVPAGRQMWEMKIPISDILEVKRAAGGA